MCNFSSSSAGLLSDSGCLPEIYLVSGRTTCSSLPETVSATKLAEIHQAGSGESLLDISWSELSNTCVLIVRRTSCSEGGEDVSDSNTETPEETTLPSLRDSCDQLRIVPVSVFRIFSILNLSGFTILLSGSARKSV